MLGAPGGGAGLAEGKSELPRGRRDHSTIGGGAVPAAKPSQAIAGKKTDAGSKQARVIAMLQSPAGATIAAFEPTTFTRCAPIRIIPCSDAPKLSNNIIQKGLAFGRDWSGTVASSGRHRALRDPAPPACWPRWGFGGAARRRHEPNGGSQCQSLRRSDRQRVIGNACSCCKACATATGDAKS